MPGPPPKENAVRRNARTAAMRLPAVTLSDPPAWPLVEPRKRRAPRSDDPKQQQLAQDEIDAEFIVARERELEVWADLWRLPQAAAWHKMRVARVVGRYARLLVDAEMGGDTAGECRLLEDRLGLSPMSMLRLRWTVDEDEVAERRELVAVPTSAEHKQATELKKRRRRMATDDGAATG